MRSDVSIREEPGEYRMTARYSQDGSFSVFGESARPITLTVRVEDVWDRMPKKLRKYSYVASVWRDGADAPFRILDGVAPDARIFLDFEKIFRIDFK